MVVVRVAWSWAYAASSINGVVGWGTWWGEQGMLTSDPLVDLRIATDIIGGYPWPTRIGCQAKDVRMQMSVHRVP